MSCSLPTCAQQNIPPILKTIYCAYSGKNGGSPKTNAHNDRNTNNTKPQTPETPDSIVQNMVCSDLPDDILKGIAKHLNNNDVKNMMLGLKLARLSKITHQSDPESVLLSIFSRCYRWLSNYANKFMMRLYNDSGYSVAAYFEKVGKVGTIYMHGVNEVNGIHTKSAKLSIDSKTLTITYEQSHIEINHIIENFKAMSNINLNVEFKIITDESIDEWSKLPIPTSVDSLPPTLKNAFKLLQSMLSHTQQTSINQVNSNTTELVPEPSFWAAYAENWKSYYVGTDASIKILNEDGSKALLFEVQQKEPTPSAGPFRSQTGGRFVKLDFKHMCKDGIERVVYKKGKSCFVKCRQKSGKYEYVKINLKQ